MKKINYIELLDAFIKGELPSDKRQQLQDWCQKELAEETLEAFYQEQWTNSYTNELTPEIQHRIYRKIKIQISEEKRQRGAVRRYSWWQYAAIAILCIGLGIGIGSRVYTDLSSTASQPTEERKEHFIAVEKGQRANVTLPDGTRVWLNSHTTLRYSSEYGFSDRYVSLQGEAYFEVAKDENLHFVVKTGEMEIEALGTAFNVKAYREDNEIKTTLFNGQIKASTAEEELILTPNQYVSYNRSEHSLKSGVSEDASYDKMWLNNELSFDGQTLSEIAIILNRLSNVHVEFASEAIKKYKFSGVIKNNSLDNIIEIISLTAPIVYESRGDTIVLSEKHKAKE
ncbi:FecR domain-containing protein [Parabacteroides sp. PF5-9]|uniref:FecR domain-containing protein n=1 Tax=Parabacteroides sp. PF5-9 TaxID=1742404 RepID=UPI002476A15A|nr:FecR domain-containing protein [Parabacteroides sp. PF5-9]MDH6358725.1 transmembrane sensor [Parabacteroides sp. PF5-9]